MSYLSPIEDAREQLLGVLVGWDWTNYFPSDYTGTIGVDMTTEWPSDQLQNISPAPNGMLKKPLISVTDLTSRPAQGRNGAALGKVLGAGAGSTTRYGQSLDIAFQIDCWADLQVGAGDQAQRLGGGVIDCLFVNRNALASYRWLQVTGGRLDMMDAPQLWRSTFTVTGRLVQSYDL